MNHPTRVNVQDPFLNMLRKDRVPVAVYLVNGIKLQGEIESFDQGVVLLRNDGGAQRGMSAEREDGVPARSSGGRPLYQMVFKHAISTVQPMRSVPSLYQTRAPDERRRPYGQSHGPRAAAEDDSHKAPDDDSYHSEEQGQGARRGESQGYSSTASYPDDDGYPEGNR